MNAPPTTARRDDVAGGSVAHAAKCLVKARCAPAARSVVLPQDHIYRVVLAFEQVVKTRAEQDAHAATVPGCMARSTVARTRCHVACGCHVAQVMWINGVMWLKAEGQKPVPREGFKAEGQELVPREG